MILMCEYSRQAVGWFQKGRIGTMIRLDASDYRNMLTYMKRSKNEVSNVSEFLKRAKEIRDAWWSKANDPWGPWFRGHQQAGWRLYPRLYRDYDIERRNKLRIEDEICEEFAMRAPALSHVKVIEAWDGYFLMQHYGVPTRLLDWTESALIGLYFAVKGNQGLHDASVWVLDPYELSDRVLGHVELVCPTINMESEDQKRLGLWLPRPFARNREKLPTKPVPILPAHVAPRISSQRSCFTIHGSDVDGLERLQADNLLIKLIIPSYSVVKIRRELEIYGIDEVTIFPDLDGLGRCVSARWQNDRPVSPHKDVCTRLKPSKVHRGGVGVFAITDIEKGRPLFNDGCEEMLWVDESEFKRAPLGIRRLYRDFSVFKKEINAFGCPTNFNRLTISWYLNEPKRGSKPNVYCENYDFYAARKIKAGEELTVKYPEYSDPMPTWLIK